MDVEAKSPCINCGGTAFTRNQSLAGLPTIDSKGNVVVGGPIIPVVALSCNDCGVLRLFQAQVAGAI